MPQTVTGPRAHVDAAHLARRPSSVRRTTTIDMTWPRGPAGPLHMAGLGRDLATSGDRTTDVLDHAVLDAALDTSRVLTSVMIAPHVVDLTALAGHPVGSGYRRRLATAVPAERGAGTLVHLLLDDLVGASIVSDFALRSWHLYDETPNSRTPRRMVGLCTGFTEGSTALHPDGTSTGRHMTLAVAPLTDDVDPVGWHAIPAVDGVTMRRARRLDVWTADGKVVVDAMFQDSSSDPAGERRAVHEYRIALTADIGSGRITTLDATPRTLPYQECPFATASLDRLLGTPLRELRDSVPSVLRGTAGCTHLNDALRGLSDLPGLLSRLR